MLVHTMEIGDSDLLFIDVDASTPPVKQEDDETPEAKRSKRVRSAPELRFKCSTCSYVTYHRALFREHRNRHYGIKPYKCELCPYSSVSKQYVKQHQARHAACECGHVARSARHMRQHSATCGRPAPHVAHKCGRCQRDYADEKALAQHCARSQSCPLCSRALCAGAGSLRSHLSRDHQVDHKPHRFECSVCGWRSSSSRGVLLHLIHHPQRPPDRLDLAPLTRAGILPIHT